MDSKLNSTNIQVRIKSNTMHKNTWQNSKSTYDKKNSIKYKFPQCTKGHLWKAWQVKVMVTQSCLTLCYAMDYTVHGIL